MAAKRRGASISILVHSRASALAHLLMMSGVAAGGQPRCLRPVLAAREVLSRATRAARQRRQLYPRDTPDPHREGSSCQQRPVLSSCLSDFVRGGTK